jgi:hypothetical protein
MFTWYWLADVCAAEGIAFVLGHALAMKAIHGGKAKNDKIDSHKIASLLRGGVLPQAFYARRVTSPGWSLRSGSPCRHVETSRSRSLPSATSCTSSFDRIAAFTHLTVCSGWCCDSCGLGGETRWCWSNRRRSTVGIATGSIDAGAAARDVLADHAAIQNVEA